MRWQVFFCKSAGPPGRLTTCGGEPSSRNGSPDLQGSQRPTTCVRVQRVCCACIKAVWDRICPPDACFGSPRRARRFCSLRGCVSGSIRVAKSTRTLAPFTRIPGDPLEIRTGGTRKRRRARCRAPAGLCGSALDSLRSSWHIPRSSLHYQLVGCGSYAKLGSAARRRRGSSRRSPRRPGAS